MNSKAFCMKRILSPIFVLTVFFSSAFAAEPGDRLRATLDTSVTHWKYIFGDVLGAQTPDFNDAAWESVSLGHEWRPHDSTCWFRTTVVVPETIAGVATRGATVRMRIGIDNGGRVYVNGRFQQEFTWDKGDVVLTTEATPGQKIVVAVLGINGPGQGRLIYASLATDRAGPFVAPLKSLLSDMDRALDGLAYVPATDAARWRERVVNAESAVDLDALRTQDEKTFLASVDTARAILFSDRATFETRLLEIDAALKDIQQRILKGKALGRQLAYPTANARVIESFLQYARDDMADAKPGRQIRALRIADFLANLVADTTKEIDQIETDATRDFRVPRYTTGPIEIRDAAFWRDRQPLFFTGVGHFGQVRQDVPILNDYGLNIIQIEVGPSAVLLDPTTVSLDRIRTDVLATLDNAARHNVAVNLLISPHYYPDWAAALEPEHGVCGKAFMKHCIDSPLSRAVYERFLATLMPLIAHHPALHSICLSNEPQYAGRCAYAKAAFHAWLIGQYGDLAAINRAYESDFRTLDEIPIPETNEKYPLYFDFNRFNQARFTAFHRFLADEVHRYDAALPVHAKVMSHAFEDPGRFEFGINFEEMHQVDAISGNDCIQTFNTTPNTEYAQDFLNMAMNYTLQRSVAPGNPIFNSENHIIVDGDTHYIPAAHIRTAYYTQALHGQGATTTWIWERGQGGDSEENILTRPECVLALGRTALDLNRLAPEMIALQRAPATVAILYSYSSLPVSMDHVDETRAAFEGVYFSGATGDFVTERQIVGGKLSRYEMLLVPNATHAPVEVVHAIQQYIDEGGLVVTSGDCFTHDEHGRAHGARLQSRGSGMLNVRPAGISPRGYRGIIENIAKSRPLFGKVTLRTTRGERPWGIHARAIKFHGGTLVSLVNFTRSEEVIDIETEGKIEGLMDLLTMEPVSLPLSIRPLELMLLYFTGAQP